MNPLLIILIVVAAWLLVLAGTVQFFKGASLSWAAEKEMLREANARLEAEQAAELLEADEVFETDERFAA